MSLSPDRHQVRREKSRDAILRGALELTALRGAPDFTFDELAEHSDVSRRTVFNHFATRDDLVIAMCADVLSGVTAHVADICAQAPIGQRTRADFFRTIDLALTTVGLPDVIESIARIVGTDVTNERDGVILAMALSRVREIIRTQAARRLPDADEFDIELLCSAIVNGVCVASEIWLSAARDGEPPDNKRWQELSHRLVQSLEGGYLR